jgi:predicted nucleic acid-binding protein
MFWDSSALVPLLLPEPRSLALSRLAAADDLPVLWWATPLECLSAVYRSRRDGRLHAPESRAALARLRRLTEDFDVVAATDPVRLTAERVLAEYALRASDALQLAAALVWCEERPAGERFVCLDPRLREAAGTEGFAVLPEA